jgi:transcriptional regulator of acetoin/glycerol metabolism
MAPAGITTVPQSWARRGPALDGEAQPGIVVAWTLGRPAFAAYALEKNAIEIGRATDGPAVKGFVGLDDPCVSRKHAKIGCAGALWSVRDHDSRNGTGTDGVRVKGQKVGRIPRVVRVGDSLIVPFGDVRPYLGGAVSTGEGGVVGPVLQRAWDAIARAATAGGVLHVVGESGAGKELAARRFHALAARPGAPFVAVNCAGIPHGIAERLLFGTRKGAYSGADADAAGYLQAAHGGTLFLDEIGELEPAVQAKLLRAIETRQVMPLGASKPVSVDVRVCSATHRDLRADVSAGRFRSDLYYRIGRPEVVIPPLRDRPEEIPWLLARIIERAHVSLVEQCVLRPWPGNVRELDVELRTALGEAQANGVAEVESRHLSLSAGQANGELEAAPPARPARTGDQDIEAALERAGGNVSAAARELGMHRTQLRRRLQKSNKTKID